MEDSRLYIVQGRGDDAVGLVGTLANRVSQVGGNIVDLRQDVLHGLFTLYMVVDLGGSDVRIDDFKTLVAALSEDTGLTLEVDRYFPRPRPLDKRNILLVLLGADKPGIIASACEALANYRANIEFSKTVAREGIFLMELLTDVSRATIPLANLSSSIQKTMADNGIQCVFQLEDVFNKRKRVILFDLRQSLLRPDQLGEILEHTALTAQRLERAYGHKEPLAALRAASELLEGVPADVMATVVEGVTATSDTVELLQTLKVMGYKIVVVSTAFSPITESISARLGLDDCHGVRLALDDDSRTYVGEIRDDDYLQTRAATVAPRVALREGLGEADVTVISDQGLDCTPGVHLRVDLGRILELYNTHALSQDWLLGLLGSFGVSRSFH